MKRLALLLLLLGACSQPASTPATDIEERPREIARAAPVSDLQFNDYQLQVIAMDLIREARSRGIEEISGRNRIERLLLLESSLGTSQHALDRVNELTRHLLAADASRWAKLRQRAELDLANRTDPDATRARELIAAWQREKSAIAFRYLSSNYTRFISSMEWERRFHEFIATRPADVAAWAWLLAHDNAQTPHADAETAYRNYLAETGAAEPSTARVLKQFGVR
jgi:hypothetical protein